MSQALATENLATSQEKSSPKEAGVLLSPLADFLMIGGASLLVFALVWWLPRTIALDTGIVRNFSIVLILLVNYPHFMLSYQLLYSDNSATLFSNPRFLWAGVGVPIILILLCLYIFVSGNTLFLAGLAQAMFFLVGWHYIRQIYGTIMVTSSLNKTYYSALEKNILQINLYSVWALSFIAFNVGVIDQFFIDIEYLSLGLPLWMLTTAYIFFALSAIPVVVMLWKRHVAGNPMPHLGMISLVSIYVWMLPLLSNPIFALFIPFFHSLQYMLFVGTLKKNEFESREEMLPAHEQKATRARRRAYGYYAIAFGLGILGFFTAPRFLDMLGWYDASVFGTSSLFYIMTVVFINIHHYFIDNAIWRRDNPNLKKYLFKSSLN